MPNENPLELQIKNTSSEPRPLSVLIPGPRPPLAEPWNERIAGEFFRGMRNGAVMGFAIGFALAWVLLP